MGVWVYWRWWEQEGLYLGGEGEGADGGKMDGEEEQRKEEAAGKETTVRS